MSANIKSTTHISKKRNLADTSFETPKKLADTMEDEYMESIDTTPKQSFDWNDTPNALASIMASLGSITNKLDKLYRKVDSIDIQLTNQQQQIHELKQGVSMDEKLTHIYSFEKAR